MPLFRTVLVDGVGLLGGSIGMALRGERIAAEVVGLGRSKQRLELARTLGAIDRWSLAANAVAHDVDLAVICTPVHQIADRALLLAEHLPERAILTDAGSTKAAICSRLAADELTRERFVGSHPLAGGHLGGVEHARADLFQGRLAIVTPVASTRQGVTEHVIAFWEALGCATRTMSPAEHDEALAFTSHAPHLVAAALAASTPVQWLGLTASGWADATRIASSNPDLWIEIFKANRVDSLRALDNFAKVLGSILSALDRNDPEALRRLLESGKRNRDAVAS